MQDEHRPRESSHAPPHRRLARYITAASRLLGVAESEMNVVALAQAEGVRVCVMLLPSPRTPKTSLSHGMHWQRQPAALCGQNDFVHIKLMGEVAHSSHTSSLVRTTLGLSGLRERHLDPVDV